MTINRAPIHIPTTEVGAIAKSVENGDFFCRETSSGKNAYRVVNVLTRGNGNAVLRLHGLGDRIDLGDFNEYVSKLLRYGYVFVPKAQHEDVGA